ncbi:MAG: hypothetical protein ACFCUE_04800 [Candidatus Bathyarchaeia archaeon]|jgi:methionine synthase II (cobalamin-independent)
MVIETTVVGSFPPLPIKPLEVAIKEIIQLQLCHNIDLISDGEQRNNMIQYFEQILGLEQFGDGLRIVGKVEPIKPAKLDEFYKITDFKTVKTILKDLCKDVKVKISITGPMTLGTICASADINSTTANYNLDDEETLFSDFSQALLPIAQRLLELGAYLQIDEPLLSTGQIPLETAKTVLKKFVTQIPSSAIKEEKIICHVCGSIKSVPGLYEALLGLGIPVLSVGFSGDLERENFDVFSRDSLKQHGVKLAAGFLSNNTVEDQATVIERCNRIMGKVGRENIQYLCPDCGFRATPLKKVEQILEEMTQVAKQTS